MQLETYLDNKYLIISQSYCLSWNITYHWSFWLGAKVHLGAGGAYRAEYRRDCDAGGMDREGRREGKLPFGANC